LAIFEIKADLGVLGATLEQGVVWDWQFLKSKLILVFWGPLWSGGGVWERM